MWRYDTVGRTYVAISKTIWIHRAFHHHAQRPYELLCCFEDMFENPMDSYGFWGRNIFSSYGAQKAPSKTQGNLLRCPRSPEGTKGASNLSEKQRARAQARLRLEYSGLHTVGIKYDLWHMMIIWCMVCHASLKILRRLSPCEWEPLLVLRFSFETSAKLGNNFTVLGNTFLKPPATSSKILLWQIQFTSEIHFEELISFFGNSYRED